ncbi:MAG: hypothetical protein E7350_03630 [Clostridiales bacterium]|nr:hypothetical protein [Clostridiales bacterium]
MDSLPKKRTKKQKRIKRGEIFAFDVDSKYGIIQVIKKSKIAGYDVRVFYDLIDMLTEESVEDIINEGRYYFLRDFYENDLVNKSQNRFLHKPPLDIKIPRYMRQCERKLNGDLVWFVVDKVKGKVVKTSNKCDDDLIDLSPAEAWGIEHIKKRWKEHFTLERWCDLANAWYLEYLENYEPQKLCAFNVDGSSATKAVFRFLEYVNQLNVTGDLEAKISELYDEFEFYDYDLLCFNTNNEIEKQLKEIFEFYYNNVEESINNFSPKVAFRFICELKALVKECLAAFSIGAR